MYIYIYIYIYRYRYRYIDIDIDTSILKLILSLVWIVDKYNLIKLMLFLSKNLLEVTRVRLVYTYSENVFHIVLFSLYCYLLFKFWEGILFP